MSQPLTFRTNEPVLATRGDVFVVAGLLSCEPMHKLAAYVTREDETSSSKESCGDYCRQNVKKGCSAPKALFVFPLLSNNGQISSMQRGICFLYTSSCCIYFLRPFKALQLTDESIIIMNYNIKPSVHQYSSFLLLI